MIYSFSEIHEKTSADACQFSEISDRPEQLLVNFHEIPGPM
jgi:hypothetical protein